MTAPAGSSALHISKAATLMRCGDTVSHSEISGFAAQMRAEAPWHLPLLHALLAGEIALCPVQPGQSLPMAKIKSCGIPVVVHILDDGPHWLGPDSFPCASYALDWSRAVVMNGTGGEANYYDAAILRAIEVKRVTIIDCGTEHFGAWCRCIIANAPGRPVLAITAPPGEFHPTEHLSC